MPSESTAIQDQTVFRSDAEPGGPEAGDIWFDTSGNNTEFNQYTGSTWECVIARGPDTPEYPVQGSLWRNDNSGSLEQYDGSSWGVIGLNNPLDENLDGGGYDITNLGGITTAEGDITGETFVRATRGTSNTGISAGTWANVFDGESEDNRNEFNSSAQFSPDETAKYRIVAIINFGNGSAGDGVRVRTRNVTDSTTVDNTFVVVQDTGGNPRQGYSWIAELDSAKNYEVQGTNPDSQFKIDAAGTVGKIVREVVNP